MNRNLLIFSILLILLGFALGAYFISIFGFFLLLPALFSTPRPRPQGPPTGSTQQAPEPAPGPPPFIETGLEISGPVAAPTVAPALMPAPPPPPSQPVFSAPLFPASIFPASIFPSASQQVPTSQAAKEARGKAPDSRDEFLELGALLALIKLAFG